MLVATNSLPPPSTKPRIFESVKKSGVRRNSDFPCSPIYILEIWLKNSDKKVKYVHAGVKFNTITLFISLTFATTITTPVAHHNHQHLPATIFHITLSDATPRDSGKGSSLPVCFLKSCTRSVASSWMSCSSLLFPMPRFLKWWRTKRRWICHLAPLPKMIPMTGKEWGGRELWERVRREAEVFDQQAQNIQKSRYWSQKGGEGSLSFKNPCQVRPILIISHFSLKSKPFVTLPPITK